MVGGDFNDILYAHEKKGCLPREEARMEDFRRTLEDCFLEDIGFSGPWFTWERGQILEQNIRERIDRCVATESWSQTFPNYSLRHLPHSFSDHCPLLAETEDELNDEERSKETLVELMEVKLHLNMEMDKKERYWEQRARENWLQLGDKNTSFFHKYASQRRRINCIQGLQRSDRSIATNESEIEEIARLYFSILFESKGVGDMEHILSGINACISDSMNQIMLNPYTEAEIIEALNGMGPTKALGSDGFPAIFYQKFWHIVLNHGQSMEDINKTLLVLIPKTVAPTNLKNFRPISLCTVLDACIDDSQSAFVPDRLITDNVLLAYEILHTLKNKRTGRKGSMALKLDMSKAYDRVEWPFIKGVMSRMGFADGFIELIFRCISSVQYSILSNGEEGARFRSTRGLRQGDPLSPYLFIFCGEGLSALMRLARQKGRIRGVKLVEMLHDCILFGDVSNRGINVLKEIFKEYEVCSGQCVNFEKSSVFFSSNVNDQERNLVCQALNVQNSNDPNKYLGLQSMVGRKRKLAFQVLKDRLKQRINSWSTRHISQGGREVFIKAILQAIPTYSMTCFLLPKSLCLELESIMNSFWWNKTNRKRGMHWCDWKPLRASKEEGGLGFRDLNSFNIVLLAKQGWHLLRHPNSLLARTLKAKYYKRSDFLNSRLGNLPSFTWKSLWSAKGLLLKGLGWRVGDGQKISVWDDRWVPGGELVNSQITSQNPSLGKVAELIDNNTMRWNEEVIFRTFAERDAERILCIPLSTRSHEDYVIWREEATGEYTVRSGHRILAQGGHTQIQNSLKNFYKKTMEPRTTLKNKDYSLA
ncbi:reverse transcriptase [Gossypium australe]|uniref:Reverse transcriptase n=1 Tax=Gossypium australe TaxID=47621 RepID=A0A5B6USI3_9ROSI|nr:reverse transcriptase [Gossypium australe]